MDLFRRLRVFRSKRPRGSLRKALSEAQTEEKVRGFLALFLVGVLLMLVFKKPPGDAAVLAPVIASAQTLAIAVIAFYFGLHGATPQGETPQTSEQNPDPPPEEPPTHA